MRFATVFATASGLAATTFAAPAAEPVPVCNDLPYRPGPYQGRPGNGGDRPTTAATLNFPATCTAIVTSVATSTVVVTEAETYISTPASTTLPIPGLEQPKCVTDEDADSIATVFQLLIQEYSDELALAALTEDFVDWSSAVNILMNGGAQFPKNITGPTFAGRQAFMDGQGSQPQIPFTKLNTFHGCDSMSLRWMTERSANGQKTEVAAIVSHTLPHPTQKHRDADLDSARHWQCHHRGRAG